MWRLAVALVGVALAACDSRPQATTPGGGVASATAGAELSIPPGALDGPGVVALEPRDPPADAAAPFAGGVWSVRVDGEEHVRFRRPATLRLPYDPALVAPGMFVTLAVLQDGAWNPVPGAVADAATTTVSARVTHLSDYAPVLTAVDVERKAQWYGTYVRARSDRDFPAGPPVYMVSGATSSRVATIVAREEQLVDGTEAPPRRFVVESVSIRLRYEGRIATVDRHDSVDQYTVLEPNEVSFSLSEQDLAKPMDEWYRVKLEEKRREVAAARRAVDEATRALDRAPSRGDAEAELERLTTVWSAELLALRHLEFNGLSSWSDFNAGGSDEETWAAATVKHPSFTYEEVTWDLAGSVFELPSGQGERVSRKEELFQSFGARAAAGEPLTESKEHRDDQVHRTETASFVRVAMDGSEQPYELTLRGTVLHRLLADGGEAADQFLGERPGQEWPVLSSRAIPAAGRAHVEARVMELAHAVEEPPVATAATDETGAFELTVRAPPDRLLALDVIWRNAEAQLEEHVYLQVPLYLPWMISACLEDGAPPARLPNVARRGAVFARYAGAPTMFDLGSEARGGTVKRLGPRRVEVEFGQLDALLLGTAVLRETHVNQERNGSRVSIRARLDEIRAAIPAGRKAEVEGRITAADVGEDGRVDVLVQGSEVCFPVGVLMALDYLGYESIELDEDGATPLVAHVMQSVYNWYDGMMTAGRIGARWDAPGLAGWPFVDRDDRDETMHWLMSIDGWRAWQDPDRLKRALEDNAAYDGLTFRKIVKNAFAEAGRKGFLAVLPSGGTALCRIPHERAAIGHLLVFAGVVINRQGKIVRAVFHDPYGDQTRHPTVEGYHGGPRNSDVDRVGHAGRYAPYGNAAFAVNSHGGRIETTWFAVLRRGTSSPSAGELRARMLPGE